MLKHDLNTHPTALSSMPLKEVPASSDIPDQANSHPEKAIRDDQNDHQDNEARIKSNDDQHDIYGSFYIGDMEFALSVKAIHEVVNEPAEYKRLPLSPSYLLGLFNLRGLVVPVVDLSQFFHEKPNPQIDSRKIAIIEYASYCVGILFDDTGEILSGYADNRSNFGTLGELPRERIIQGVFKFDQGKRIVLILDPYEVLQLDKIPHSENQLTAYQKQKKLGKRHQCISFFVGDSLCAIDIHDIQEIVNVDSIPNTALSSGHCLGAIDLRGTTVPIMNFGALLGCQSKTITNNDLTDPEGYRIIIMKLDGHLFGFMVDSVESIIAYFQHELVQFPILNEDQKNIFQGCIIREGGIDTILLDCLKILSGKDIEAITKINHTLNQESISITEAAKKSCQKKTYITFSIDENYAMDINEVKEVLDFPESVIQPPNLPQCFSGMFNLRGELVAIIDPRVLYGNAVTQAETDTEKKLLIFSVNNHKYGLIVDSVNSIVSYNAEDTMKLAISSTSPFRPTENSLGEQVHEVIRVSHTDQSQSTLQVLTIPSITAKIEEDLNQEPLIH